MSDMLHFQNGLGTSLHPQAPRVTYILLFHFLSRAPEEPCHTPGLGTQCPSVSHQMHEICPTAKEKTLATRNIHAENDEMSHWAFRDEAPECLSVSL